MSYHKSLIAGDIPSEVLYKRADEARRREFENELVEAFQVTFQCLNLEDKQKSYNVNMIVKDDKVYKKGNNCYLQLQKI